MERVQTQFLMTESAGTAQGVDVYLCTRGEGVGGVLGLHGACANPIFDLQNRRVQFWLRRPHFCLCCALLGCWASVGTILSSCSAILGVFCGLCWPLLGKS